MSTVNDWLTTVNGVTAPGNYGVSAAGVDEPVLKRRFIDCVTNPMTSGEYHKVLAVAANTLVRVAIVCQTAEGAADTIDVALVADTDTTAGTPIVLLNDFELNTNTFAIGQNSVYLVHNTIGFTSVAASLQILANAALTAAKFWVIAEFIPLKTTD
jgi:hypothetical protein